VGRMACRKKCSKNFGGSNLFESGRLQEIESGAGSIFSWILIKQVENVEYFRYFVWHDNKGCEMYA
jgi:hypothetical protein